MDPASDGPRACGGPQEATLSGISGVGAIVTGAGRGIARAVALALLREGARVALLARTASALDEVAGAWRAEAGTRRGGATGTDAIPIVCDVTDGASVRAAVA